MEPIILELDKIRLDGGTQPRAQLDMLVIQEYAQAMLEGATFPPVIVFYDGTDHWLADGFHRVNAGRQAGKAGLLADVRTGTRRDAILHACSANAAHGLRRTNADKRRVVELMLADSEWATWSDREIARRCMVTHPFVSTIRGELSGNGYQIEPPAERKVERNGKTYTMDTARIGQTEEPSVPPAIEIEFGGDATVEADVETDVEAEVEVEVEVEVEAEVKAEVKSEQPGRSPEPEHQPGEQIADDACPKCKVRPSLYGFDRRKNSYKCGTCGTVVDLVVTRAKRNKVEAEAEAKVCPACGKAVNGTMCGNCGEVISG